MSAGFIVIGLLCVAVVASFILVCTNPKFDRVTTTTVEGTSDKLLMWYTPLFKPTIRKYIVVKDYGRINKQ